MQYKQGPFKDSIGNILGKMQRVTCPPLTFYYFSVNSSLTISHGIGQCEEQAHRVSRQPRHPETDLLFLAKHSVCSLKDLCPQRVQNGTLLCVVET